MAVEITVTNTMDYELKNIGKCLGAGVSLIAVVGVDEKKLEESARNAYATHAPKLIGFFRRDTFVARLQELILAPQIPEPVRPLEKQTRHKGWKVNTTVVEISAEEMKEREAEAARILAGGMRRPKHE